MAKLNPLLAKELTTLRALPAAAIDPVDDWDELERLNTLANAVTCPDLSADDRVLLDLPVAVGNVTLRRFSLGAYLWVTEYLLRWFADDSVDCNIGIAYAMAHSRDPGKFADLVERGAARKVFRKWGRRCGATLVELADAINTISNEQAAHIQEREDGQDEPNDEYGGSYGPIIPALTKEFGESKEYWLWEASFEYMNDCIEHIVTRRTNEARAEQQAASGGKAVAPDPANPYVRATIVFRKAWRAFKDSKLSMAQGDSANG